MTTTMISITALVQAGISPNLAKLYAEPLDAACTRFGIDTFMRAAAFLGQCMAESDLFTHVEESMFYTTASRVVAVWPSLFNTEADAVPYLRNPPKLASKVYAGRNGNGGELTGDGWRYHGRGLIQLTGRANYALATFATGIDFVEQPDLAVKPEGAALTAAWFWSQNKLNPLADASRIDEITRKVNGPAMLRADARRRYTAQALAALGG